MSESLSRLWYSAASALLIFPASTSLAAMKVVVERLDDGAVRVDYVLDAEVTELAFVPAVGRGVPSARSTWSVLGDGLVLTGDRIASTSASSFSAASVRIEPMLAMGRGRPTVVGLGSRSSAIDLNRVLEVEGAAQMSVKLRNAYDVRARACVAEHEVDDVASGTPKGGIPWFVVVSTSRDACDEATHDGAVTVVAEDAPPGLELVASRELTAANRRLAERFGRPLDPPPTLILAYERKGAIRWTPPSAESVVLARFEGESWAAPTPYQTSMLAFDLSSALVPAWLDTVAVPPARPGQSQHWILGATAQYLATLDWRSLGSQVYAVPASKTLLADIDLCSVTLEGMPGDGRTQTVPVERDPRACGLLIQFVYDAIARAESADTRTIFDVWADLLAEADGRPVDPEAFLATNERAREAVEGLVHGPSADFERIAAALRRAGIDASIGEPRDTGGAVVSLLSMLVEADCGQRPGSTVEGDRVGIKTRGSCRTLPSEVELISIAGVGILTSARDVYGAAAKSCAERDRVVLTGALASQEFEIDCPESVPALPQQLLIRNVGFLN